MAEALEEILALKAEKVREFRSRGVDPYPHRWERTHSLAEARKLGEAVVPPAKTEKVRVAGRLITIRDMGKSNFATLLSDGAKLQIYAKKDILGETAYESFKKDFHVGDYVGVEGPVFKTRTGEITVEAASVTLLSKALRPPPEKFHGLQDTEIRYRKRHLDLVANEESRKIFEMRSNLIASIRRTMADLGFLEVETPILLAQAGGATANPFKTFHRALGSELFLRIATELYLKRLIIGGFERVFEMGRIFRNEGIDTRHNPEFTMLEAYQAFTDYNGMAALFERVMGDACAALGVDKVEYRGKPLSLKPPYRRLFLPELWKEHCGEDIHKSLKGKGFDRDGLMALAKRLHIEAGPDTPSAKVFERIFDEKILSLLHEPAFIFDHPTAITPLAKCKPGDESIVERFECFIGTEEVSNAYTELNDPQDQRERFAEQAKQKAAGHEEAELLDEDFVEAMEHGMPPTGGIGFGIDRLAMLFTANPSIREVILFPTLKPETTESGNGQRAEEGPKK